MTMDPLIQPLMAEFGAAVHDAQVLERCIENILALLDKTVSPGEQLPDASKLYGSESTASLGSLVNALRKRIEVPRDVSDSLEEAIHTRNRLVHGYFKPEKRLVATLSETGIATLIAELREIRASLKGWTALTEKILDALLKRYGMSVEQLRDHAEVMYASAKLQEFRGTRH
jgi:hypothetical protein